jgi:ABC-2 type transport system ATP-binding protein
VGEHHQLGAVAQTVDQVIIVADGTLRYAGPLTELTVTQGETLEAAFLRVTSDERAESSSWAS